MIPSAEEFIRLRQSDDKNECDRASHDSAEIQVWLDVIEKYPDYKSWVIHNKTIQLEILELLCSDTDPEVRAAVARKRKINDIIFAVLSVDPDENVRYALLCNTKLTPNKISQINVDDSPWLIEKRDERIAGNKETVAL